MNTTASPSVASTIVGQILYFIVTVLVMVTVHVLIKTVARSFHAVRNVVRRHKANRKNKNV